MPPQTSTARKAVTVIVAPRLRPHAPTVRAAQRTDSYNYLDNNSKSDTLIHMTDNSKYHADDLVAVVWLTDSAEMVRAGTITLEQAGREAWAIDATKADRVAVLVAVDDRDEVVAAWRVVNVRNRSSVPAGKTRRINRASFDIEDDPALGYLRGASPWPRRRNPQTTFELRDLPGASNLLGESDPPITGIVRLGPFTLSISHAGEAVLQIPSGAAVTVRSTSAT